MLTTSAEPCHKSLGQLRSRVFVLEQERATLRTDKALLEEDVAQLQAEILESSKEVALSWLPANATLNFTLLAIELVLVLTAVRLRHRRASG